MLIPVASVSVVIVLLAADNKTRLVALSGILLALAMALLFLKTIVPVWDFSIYILISFFTGIILQEGNDRWAWIYFLALIALSLLLPVNKLSFLIFYSFFGFYGIFKFYIEKLKSRYIEFILKLVLINSALIINYLFAKTFLPGIFGDGIQLYLIILIASIFIFIYDYIYTLAMVFYNGRLKILLGGKGNA